MHARTPMEARGRFGAALRDLHGFRDYLTRRGMRVDADQAQAVIDCLRIAKRFVIPDGGRYTPRAWSGLELAPWPDSTDCIALEYAASPHYAGVQIGPTPDISCPDRIALAMSPGYFKRVGGTAAGPFVCSLFKPKGGGWQIVPGGLMVSALSEEEARAPVSIPKVASRQLAAGLMVTRHRFMSRAAPLFPGLCRELESAPGSLPTLERIHLDVQDEACAVVDFLAALQCANVTTVVARKKRMTSIEPAIHALALVYEGAEMGMHLPTGRPNIVNGEINWEPAAGP